MNKLEKDSLIKLLKTPEPADLGPGPRPGVQGQPILEKAIENSLSESSLSGEKKQLLRAIILLWHDHLDAAHTMSQDIDNADGAFVHGIMHRREPDYGNAKYWFRRVGNHAAFAEIARRVTLSKRAEIDQLLVRKIMPSGKWDSFAFIDACEEDAGLESRNERRQILKELQQIETETLVDHFLGTTHSGT